MRSLLFVPADSPRKIDKALASESDAVILDLEDSVAPERKELARDIVREILVHRQEKNSPAILVRINALGDAEINADMMALLDNPPDAIMLPKAEGAQSLHRLARLAGSLPVIAIATETPRGVLSLPTFADDSPDNLMALTWGAEDLSAQLGAAASRNEAGILADPYRVARAMCLFAARAAGVEPVDTVYVDFRDDEGLHAECMVAARDGFTGKMAIHPAQAAIINAAFTPAPEQVEQARKVSEAFAREPDAGVVAIDGKMFDRPHLVRAENLLARARRYGVA